MTIGQGHHGTVYCVKHLVASNRIASGADDKKVRLWEISKGKWKSAHCLRGHTEGRVLDERIRILGRSLPFSGVCCLAFDSVNDNRLLMSGSLDKTIRVWDTHRHKHLKTISNTHKVKARDLATQTIMVAAVGNIRPSVR